MKSINTTLIYIVSLRSGRRLVSIYFFITTTKFLSHPAQTPGAVSIRLPSSQKTRHAKRKCTIDVKSTFGPDHCLVEQILIFETFTGRLFSFPDKIYEKEMKHQSRN